MSADLAGRLRLRCDMGRVNLWSTRREWAATVAVGRPAEALPGLLAGVYALCGGAHRLAAAHAVRAARGSVPVPGAAERAQLHADTAREHLRRLWLEAAALLPEDQRPGLPALRACPWLGDSPVQEAHRQWLATQVLGLSPQQWLGHWAADAQAWALAWSEAGATPAARWLRAGRRALGGLAVPVRALAPLVPLGRPDGLQALAEALATDASFALRPTWRGAPAETGPWTRQLPLAPAEAFAPLWMRLAARLAELARLSLEAAPPAQCERSVLAQHDGLVTAQGTEPLLAQGGLPLAAGEGLGWCEMARGLLLHHVRLTPDGRARHYRVLAPTEWNFHPEGPAVQAWAGLGPDPQAITVRWVAAAYDPCVELDLEITPQETAHA